MPSDEVSAATWDFHTWRDFQERHSVGVVADATVVSVASVGAFVEIEPGIHGFLHKDSWDRPLEIGDWLPVRIAEWGPPRLSVVPAR
ncbi:MAG: S1 RNA-binding domain-containing protein [Mycolicibacterium sp.]|uniref:S1 RNA-binding domain-containing protein n=1 Tax=Mycolicibacterium sp. TaxID=2320850 RepID=UPI003560F366